MGNRGNIVTIEGAQSIVFYSHYLGDIMPKILQTSLKRYKEKGGDKNFVNSHYIRTFICGELMNISNDRLINCGNLKELIQYPLTFSIGVDIPDNDNPIVEINFNTKTVRLHNSEIFYSFERFIDLNLEESLYYERNNG